MRVPTQLVGICSLQGPPHRRCPIRDAQLALRPSTPSGGGKITPRLCGHHASRNVDPLRGEAGGAGTAGAMPHAASPNNRGSRYVDLRTSISSSPPRLCGHHASRNVDPLRGEAGGPGTVGAMPHAASPSNRGSRYVDLRTSISGGPPRLCGHHASSNVNPYGYYEPPSLRPLLEWRCSLLPRRSS